MSTRSAGILLFRRSTRPPRPGAFEVFLGHMGGPFFARKDSGAWTIPKGLVDATDADDWATAQREFEEETGQPVPAADVIDLGIFQQSKRKEIHVFGVDADLDASACVSNEFDLEWPPRSGQVRQFPEIDRFAWFPTDAARNLVIVGQQQVFDALAAATCTDST